MSTLYDKIIKLRLTAAVLYDVGTANGLTEEQKGESIAPIKRSYDDLVKRAVETDLAEVIRAIHNHEEDIASEHKRSEWHLARAKEAKSYADTLYDLIKQKMIRDNLTEKTDRGYMVTLIDGKVVIR